MLIAGLKNTKGMTLVEVMITTLVFVSAVVALGGAIISCVNLIDITREQDVAVTDLKNIMEKIRATPFDSITTQFPDGLTHGPGGDAYANMLEGYSLTNEAITVSYADVSSDPLEILVTITWQSKRGRAYSASMATMRTR